VGVEFIHAKFESVALLNQDAWMCADSHMRLGLVWLRECGWSWPFLSRSVWLGCCESRRSHSLMYVRKRMMKVDRQLRHVNMVIKRICIIVLYWWAVRQYGLLRNYLLRPLFVPNRSQNLQLPLNNNNFLMKMLCKTSKNSTMLLSTMKLNL
jgi:hypothetical protein